MESEDSTLLGCGMQFLMSQKYARKLTKQSLGTSIHYLLVVLGVKVEDLGAQRRLPPGQSRLVGIRLRPRGVRSPAAHCLSLSHLRGRTHHSLALREKSILFMIL